MSTIHPTPSGTRDVLPDEMREVHAIVEGMRRVFDEHGYGEIHNVREIDRGYERIDERLRALGARIERQVA